MTTQHNQVIYHSLMFGCDPELFFEQNGRVIGAEKVIAEAGLSSKSGGNNSCWGKDRAFVLDGVQVELNPRPNYCRASLGNELSASFLALKQHLAGMKDITASFRSVVDVDKAELASLSEKARVLGCAPSLNMYDKAATVSVNAATYTKRSAGGHIHIGLDRNIGLSVAHIMPYREELVPLLDVLVGLPSVLVDRDPHAAERRQVYGRAGEYRLPAHGVEYRTLSNFWLRSYQLMSMVMGLTRLAASVLLTKHDPPVAYSYPSKSWDAPATLLRSVDLELVREAINTNDLMLAKKAFEPVQAFIRAHVLHGDLGLNAALLDDFSYFTKVVEEKGIEYWFPQDPIDHWCNLPEGHSCGWENFLAKKVRIDRLKAGDA